MKPALYEQLVTAARHLLKVLERALGSLGQAHTPAETVNQLLLQLIEVVQRGAVDRSDLLRSGPVCL